ncbi:hypothetical protein QCA50_014706 [Cerrena zonata]|uniref:DNA 3'-5' helicase n=1 Tax=Cerrena zonata TaxID=2478898 RepID=A0AAW0FZD3_9APHY
MSPACVREWSIEDIRDLVMKRFGKRACWFQIQIALALRKGKDVVGIAATGAGKTLSFWIALLMAIEEGRDSMVVVVTPLNLLGKKNVEELSAVGISAVAVDSKSATPGVFKDIERGRYHVVVVNPEVLMKEKGDFDKLWQKPHVTSRLLHFIYDEAHCVAEWAAFREEYKEVSIIRHILPKTIPVYVASATLPPPILEQVKTRLQLHATNTEVMQKSNDRPNINIIVRALRFAANTYQDLAFLIPKDPTVETPPKFLIFFDSTKETQDAVDFLQSCLPAPLREKIKWFHSTMTPQYREEEFEALRKGEIWGLCVTDAFGLGLDLSDIELVAQWKATCSLCSLWQRFGRAARNLERIGQVVFFVEKKYLDEEREKSAIRADKKKQAAAKRKATQQIGPSSKRLASNSNTPLPVPLIPPQTTSSATPDVPNIGLSTEAIFSGPTHISMVPPETTTHTFPHRANDAGVQDPERSHQQTSESTRIEIEKRRSTYHEQEEQHETPHQRTSNKKGVHLGGPIDDLINAGTRDGLGCRRKVIEIYFENDKTADNTDHLDCDNDCSTGCLRCAPRIPLACCDLCSPKLLEIFQSQPEHTIKNRAPQKSHCAPYEMEPRDRDFKRALSQWREEKACEMLGEFDYEEYGAPLFMSDSILQRIADCFHYGKILTVESIKKETHWRSDLTDTYGTSLLAVVQQFNPQATVTGNQQTGNAPATTATSSAMSVSVPTTKSTKTRVCSACKQPGHNKSNKACPARAVLATTALISNIPPAPPVPPSTPLPIPTPTLGSQLPFRYSAFSSNLSSNLTTNSSPIGHDLYPPTQHQSSAIAFRHSSLSYPATLEPHIPFVPRSSSRL